MRCRGIRSGRRRRAPHAPRRRISILQQLCRGRATRECPKCWLFGERTSWEVKWMVGKPFTCRMVALVCLVCLVYLVEPDEPDEPDKPHLLRAIGESRLARRWASRTMPVERSAGSSSTFRRCRRVESAKVAGVWQRNGQPALLIDRAEGVPSNLACAYRNYRKNGGSFESCAVVFRHCDSPCDSGGGRALSCLGGWLQDSEEVVHIPSSPAVLCGPSSLPAVSEAPT